MKSLSRGRTFAGRRRSLSAIRTALTAGVALVAVSAAGIGSAAATSVAGPATYTGLGFDNCGVPTVAQLSAWTHAKSPYAALNVYIGGLNAACPAKVSPSWVKSVTKLGWGIIPTYVGLQAPRSDCSSCAAIVASKAVAEGTAEAKDAVKIMAADGMGKGNPVYDDMEGYATGSPSTPAVLNFLKGWTVELHRLGYISGVYSGGGSGITDLVKEYGVKSYPEPNDIWVADWDNVKSVKFPYVPAADWSTHQRIHQFNAGDTLTYGGVTFKDADGDYCDGAVVSASTV